MVKNGLRVDTHFFMTRCMGVVLATSGRWPTRSGRAEELLDPCRPQHNRRLFDTMFSFTSLACMHECDDVGRERSENILYVEYVHNIYEIRIICIRLKTIFVHFVHDHNIIHIYIGG